MKLKEKIALILVDIQYDFLENGALAVPEGSKIMPTVEKLVESVKSNNGIVIATQDWHPKDHVSFASNHEQKKVFETVKLCDDTGEEYELQLWPDHCVQGSHGAELALDDAIVAKVDYIIKKGTDTNIDSFSAFADNLAKATTELSPILKKEKVKTVIIAGLAADFCVKMTCLDAVKFGFQPILVLGGTRAVDKNNMEDTIKLLKDTGVHIVQEPDDIWTILDD